EEKDKKHKKEEHGIIGSFKIISKSKFATAMCLLVLPYNIIVIMVEALQKASMKAHASEKNADIVTHVLSIQCINQLLTALILMSLLLSPFQRMIERYGWLSMGIIPPIFSLISVLTLCMVSFMNTCVKDKCSISFLIPIGAHLHTIFPFLTVEKEQWLATTALIIFKVLKYGPFDITKDTIGRRIDDEHRDRLRGVYDGICGNLGKSLGSVLTVIISYFLDSSGDIREASPIYLIIAIGMVVCWVVNVVYLNRKYHDAIARNSSIDL
ncbi:ADP,ATP carrier protein 1, partial [Dictyocoela roeselum]